MLALLLAAAQPQPVWEAERAFAAAAQTGQWAAFRAASTPEAVMFAPKMVRAHELLAKAKEPPAGSLKWGPSRALTACDGSLAFSTGPWTRADGAHGTFSTVWQRQADGGWKWLYDSGRETPAAVLPVARVAAATPVCRNLGDAARRGVAAPTGPTTLAALARTARLDLLIHEDGRQPASAPRDGVALTVGPVLVGGGSGDGSLRWQVNALAGRAEGSHLLRIWAWDGGAYRIAVIDVNGAA